jgi:DNA-binding NtrC family response regulator
MRDFRALQDSGTGMPVAFAGDMATNNEHDNLGFDIEAGGMPTPIPLDERVREYEANLIRWALRATHGNKSRAAALLQVKRSTLGDRIVRCGIERPADRARPDNATGEADGSRRLLAS